MRRVRAQFRLERRPGYLAVSVLAAGLVCLIVAAACAAWQGMQVADLRGRITHLEAMPRIDPRPAPAPDPAYAASARAMLRERAVPWASMLRTLESASMIGVTPTSVTFNAADGAARAELAFANATALFEYMQRINEGNGRMETRRRWSVAQVHTQLSALPLSGVAAQSQIPAVDGQSVAEIQSIWALE